MNKIRIIAAATILAASASTAFAGYESFDVDIYRGTQAPTQTVTTQTLAAHGKALNSGSRHQQIADTFTHLAHHRGQLTVYLRLNGVAVPAIYGPSADEM